jgi:hypothetical protein
LALERHRKVAMEEINSTRIAAHFVTCMVCDMRWRTINATRCTRCAQAYGITFQLDPLRASALMDAMRDFGNEEEYKDDEELMRFALAMEDNCPWYSEEDPWYSQTCWMHLREYLRDNPPTPHIERAMEIFEAQFQEKVVLVDERGNMPNQAQFLREE